MCCPLIIKWYRFNECEGEITVMNQNNVVLLLQTLGLVLIKKLLQYASSWSRIWGFKIDICITNVHSNLDFISSDSKCPHRSKVNLQNVLFQQVILTETPLSWDSRCLQAGPHMEKMWKFSRETKKTAKNCSLNDTTCISEAVWAV